MINPENITDYKDKYSESGFWNKLTKVGKLAGIKVVYAALLLYYVLQDPNVSLKHKAIIYGALGYFILPIDLIPDTIPFVGFTDDLSALLYAVHSVWASITPEIQQKAKEKLHKWFGAYDEAKINLS